MHKIFSETALIGRAWQHNVTLCVENGMIQSITPDTKLTDHAHHYQALVAGMPNLHSHAFQRAMAGFAERRGSTIDSFWSWRTEMYRLALSMKPQQLEDVASQLYMEMLEAGFTRVGEFHYLHHNVDGKPYDDIGEMASRIAAAAEKTSIRLTLLPVFYAHANFGGIEPIDGQKPFINNPETFYKLLTSCKRHLKQLDGSVLGIAPHSLRAVTPQELETILPMTEGSPVHIHIAEQIKEVDDCIAWSGQRPVEWLLEHQPVDDKWCLIHATHMTERETKSAALTGAIAGLCPITEGNLGDGIFNGLKFLDHGGDFGIGSDSNVCISVDQELRQLEYSLRLKNHMRNVVATTEQSNGLNLYTKAISGGKKALGCKSAIHVGQPADFVALDRQGQDWLVDDAILDNWIFTGNISVESVWIGGREIVKNGQHHARQMITGAFQKTMRSLFEK
ncbi:formimidoylglutamate deiminase [Bartonella sp. CB169]|uniref:formimidoylglutamate deiminase n=1 Tax=Bartonella sp. CB169 TaxID=3112257 RepID=UPI00300E2771